MTMRIDSFVLAAAVLVAASSSHAQQTTAAPRHPIAVAYDTHRNRMTSYVDSMPDAEFTARLTPSTKSFDEIIGHTIETNFGVCAGARKVASPKKGEKFEGVVTSKAELSALLRASHEYCNPLFEQLAVGTMASSDLSFLPLHTAQMTTLMETYLMSRGSQLKVSEAGRAKSARP